MKIAYCIICHRNTNILRTSIEILSRDSEIYLHVDKKSNIDDFSEYKGKVNFTDKRINVRWGEYSQIESMIVLLSDANKSDYDYICLLSGDCLPIKNNDEIKKFFIQNRGKEFIGIQNDFDEHEIERRIKYKNSRLSIKRNKNFIEKILFNIEKSLFSRRVNKLYNQLPQIYKGPNWFCISNELCNYILNFLKENEWYNKAFKYSRCGDEEFFQTIVMNSNYKRKIYKYNEESDDNRMALRYIDWKTGPQFPKILTERDFEQIRDIINVECLFARKFSENLDIGLYKKEFNII